MVKLVVDNNHTETISKGLSQMRSGKENNTTLLGKNLMWHYDTWIEFQAKWYLRLEFYRTKFLVKLVIDNNHTQSISKGLSQMKKGKEKYIALLGKHEIMIHG